MYQVAVPVELSGEINSLLDSITALVALGTGNTDFNGEITSDLGTDSVAHINRKTCAIFYLRTAPFVAARVEHRIHKLRKQPAVSRM